MSYDYRDLRLSMANIGDPFILTKSPQPLSNRFIEGIGSHLNDVVYTLKISATTMHLRTAKAIANDSMFASLFAMHIGRQMDTPNDFNFQYFSLALLRPM